MQQPKRVEKLSEVRHAFDNWERDLLEFELGLEGEMKVPDCMKETALKAIIPVSLLKELNLFPDIVKYADVKR